MFHRRNSKTTDGASHHDRSGSSHHKRSSAAEQENDIVVVHLSARSIVFRNHVKRADKTVRQVLEQAILMDRNDDENDADSDDLDAFSSDHDDDDDDASSSAAGSDSEESEPEELDNDPNHHHRHHHTLQDALRSSVRGSLRGLSGQESVHQLDGYNREMGKELKTLASSMVPELRHYDMCGMSERSLEIQGFQVRHVKALPNLEFTGDNVSFDPLAESSPPTAVVETSYTTAEREVVEMLHHQTACVKTIKNTGQEWTEFIQRFTTSKRNSGGKFPPELEDVPAHHDDNNFAFNCFGTSTSLLPSDGKKMRCFGSLTAYTVGVVFALPAAASPQQQDVDQERSKTWAWPAGYAAKVSWVVCRMHVSVCVCILSSFAHIMCLYFPLFVFA